MKTEINKTIEAITDYLNGLSDSELVSIHNEYCQEMGYSDDEIFNNDEEFFNTFFNGKVIEAVRAISYGEYSYGHEYVKFNGYGNLESFDNPTEEIDIKAIAAAILEEEFTPYDIELIEEEEEEQ